MNCDECGTWNEPTCPTHHIPLVAYCPACRGAKGGQVTSPAKVASSRVNAEKARSAIRRGAEGPAIGGADPGPDRPP